MIDALKPKYRYMYMAMAYAAQWQTLAEREQVGCVIVTTEGIVLPGWNGQPAGHHTNCCENTPTLEIIDGKPVSRMKTDRSVLHAENNAIGKAARAGIRLEGAHMFVTVSPCDPCARQIVPAGIKEVYYHRLHDDITGLHMLELAGIHTQHMKDFPHEILAPFYRQPVSG